jgi:protein ImuB
MGLVVPTRDAYHLRELVRSRLEGVDLPGPVEQVELRAGRIHPLAPRTPDLFAKPGAADKGSERLVDRLCSRLSLSGNRLA